MSRAKTIVLGVVIAVMLTAVAGAATASAAQFRAQGYPATVAGTQGTIQKLKLGASGTTIKCVSINLAGTESAASSALALAPTYGGCSVAGLTGTVTANGCQLTFNSISETAPYTGSLGVTCGKEGEAIEINVPSTGCVISIPAQSPVGGLEFTNEGVGRSRSFTTTYNVAGLSYVGGSKCGATVIGSRSDAGITGTSTLTGSGGGSADGVYVANTQLVDPPEGAIPFRAAEYPTTFVGREGTAQKLVFGSTTVKCSTISTSGTKSAASPTLEQSPSYGGCTLAGLAATISAHSCKHVYHVASEFTPFSGTFDISCGAGEAIEINVPSTGCVVSIPTQSGLSGVTYVNSGTGSARTITANLNLTGIKYIGGSKCPSGIVGTFTNGTLNGGSVISGLNKERPVGVYLADRQVEDAPGFRASNYPLTVETVQQAAVKFTFGASGYVCTTNHGSGPLTGPSAEVEQAMAFSCTLAGISYPIEMGGCRFADFVSTKTAGGGLGGFAIRCNEPGQEIHFKPGIGCQYNVPAQTIPGTVSYENVSSSPGSVLMTYNVSGLKYTSPNCGTSGTDGGITGSYLAKAFNAGGGTQVDLSIGG